MGQNITVASFFLPHVSQILSIALDETEVMLSFVWVKNGEAVPVQCIISFFQVQLRKRRYIYILKVAGIGDGI